MKNRMYLLGLIFFLGVSIARGQVIDGSLDAVYGAAKALQDTPTGFGDNLSELNGAYGVAHANGDLSLMLTGNLENGGNGMMLFIDSKPGGAIASTLPGGQGVIGSVGGQRTDDWGTDVDGSDNVSPTPGGGSILDPGFNPDYSIELNIFDIAPGDDFIDYFINIIDMTVPNSPLDNRDVYLGTSYLGDPGVTQAYLRDNFTTFAGNITHAFNNSNTAGVNGFDFGNPPGSLGDPTTATTGLEFLFSTEFLGGGTPRDTSLPIRVLPFITSGSGDFLANQFLPGVGGAPNLGGPGGDGGTPLFDSSLFPGNNFLTFSLIDGDFNNDGLYNCADINALTATTAAGSNNPLFDLNADGSVNGGDIDAWLLEAGTVNIGPGRAYRKGDANLDAVVDGSDFNTWNSNKFTSSTAWCGGNFNGDSVTDGSDFNVWNSNKFTASDGQLVPEPVSCLGLFLAITLLANRNRKS